MSASLGHTFHGWLVNPYVENITGNAIFVAIVAILGYLVFYGTRRRRVHHFFGLEGTKRFHVVTSSLTVPPLTTSGVDGRPRSFAGVAVPEYESRLAAEVQAFLFSVMPGSIHRPGRLRSIRWTDIIVSTGAAPVVATPVDKTSTVLSLGSSAYNSVSLQIEQDPKAFAKFTSGGDAIVIQADDGETRINLDPETTGYCFVQRLRRSETGQTRFQAAGFSAEGTGCAARFLFDHWSELSNRFNGDKRFCILIRYFGGDPSSYEEVDAFS